MEERVRAVGHQHVTATHASTFEVTTDDYLTPAGDCILGIQADLAPAGFDAAFVSCCRDASTRIEATLRAGGAEATVVGRGDPALTFGSQRALVGRTSDYVDDRTVLVGADAAAADLPRALIGALADGAPLEVVLSADG